MTSTGSALDLVFRGNDGNECEAFIAAIEEHAFTEGWSEDKRRMLLFTRSRLRQGALRWFAKLDPAKKDDWDLFVEALFDHYPPVEAPAEAGISTPIWSATTFSPNASTIILPSDRGLGLQPAPYDERHAAGINARYSVPQQAKPYDPSITGRRLGLLRIVVEYGETAPQYISRGRSPTYAMSEGTTNGVYFDPLTTTTNRLEALVICFIPSFQPHPIGCLNDAYKFGEFSLYFNPLNTDTYELRTPNRPYVGYQTGPHPGYLSNLWSVLSDGSLEASLYALDSNFFDRSTGQYTRREDFRTSEVLVNIAGTSVRFVKPGTLPWQDDPKRSAQGGLYDFKARLLFEPF